MPLFSPLLSKTGARSNTISRGSVVRRVLSEQDPLRPSVYPKNKNKSTVKPKQQNNKKFNEHKQ